VEVLRDVICDLLEHGIDRGDGSVEQLVEADIAVVCHQLDEFAPIIGSVWGPPAPGPFVPASPGEEATTPTLRYSIVDRAPRESNPVLDGLASLLELVGGRMERSAVVGFLGLPSVGNRFGLGSEERELLSSWVDQAGVRWGLDGAHRSRSVGFPEDFDASTWAAGLRQLAAGIASGEPLRLADVPGTTEAPADQFDLALGTTAITTVPDSQLQAAARILDAVCALADVVEELSAERTRTVAAWRDVLVDCADRLFAPERFADWQALQVDRVLGDLVTASGTDRRTDGLDGGTRRALHELDITLGDLRRLLGPSFHGSRVRADLGIGAIAVARPSQLVAVPYRVVCVLGLDAGALPVGGRSGDDLGAEFPLVGDRDVRSEARAELLSAITTTTHSFVVTFTSHDIRTNASVPRSAVLDELVEAVEALGVDPETLVRYHPRQAYDPANFPPHAQGDPTPGFRSFAAEAERAARVVHDRRTGDFGGSHGSLFVAEPLGWDRPESIQLEELRRFYRSPAARFLRNRLAVAMGSDDGGSNEAGDELKLELGGLDSAAFGRALFDAAVRAGTPEQLRYEQPDHPTEMVQRAVDLSMARGELPVAPVAAIEVHRVASEVADLIDAAVGAGFSLGPTNAVQIDVDVPVIGAGDGPSSSQLVGVVAQCSPAGGADPPGPVAIEFSRPKRSRLFQRSLDLLVMTAQDPSVPWRSLQVTRGAKPKSGGASPPVVTVMTVRGADPEARRSVALEALGSIVEQFTDGHRAPLVWFPETTAAFALEGEGAYKAAAGEWGDPSDSGEYGTGECQDPVAVTLFGELTFDELLELDAAGSRFADEVERSWGAVLGAVDGLVGDGGDA
jgi:exodeoxyribonuclease V gamma subunit